MSLPSHRRLETEPSDVNQVHTSGAEVGQHCVCVKEKVCVGGLLMLRQCNTDTETVCFIQLNSQMRADNYTLNLITGAGIRPAPKLVICQKSQGPSWLHPPLIWHINEKKIPFFNKQLRAFHVMSRGVRVTARDGLSGLDLRQ